MATTNDKVGSIPPTNEVLTPTISAQTRSGPISGGLRRVSLSFEQSQLPGGFFAATGGIASSVLSGRAVSHTNVSPIEAPAEGGVVNKEAIPSVAEEGSVVARTITPEMKIAEPQAAAAFPNGYHFPPKHSFAQNFKSGSIAFWHYFLTPVGFFVTIYGLNVVAWGGMLFLLLCNASPAMCYPDCNDIDSPRRKWVEWDSQILNALFCVTGFGLAPWRFRDLYFLLQYRIGRNTIGLRKLAAIHRDWFRLPGSSKIEADIGPRNIANRVAGCDIEALPQPIEKIPDAPLTAVRANDSKLWKLDMVIWLMVANTLLQCVLCGFMWGMNRYDRPSWATGLFVGLGCSVAGIGGIMMFLEGKKVKSTEGVPISKEDMELLARDRERGVFHYNNIGDKAPEAKKN